MSSVLKRVFSIFAAKFTVLKKKVVVGISGGVDSSVAAFLLKKQGYDVTGMFMINWHDITGTLAGDCPWNDDLIFAELVARKLDIPLITVDFSEAYRKRVVDYMFAEYEQGRTPNPDVLCNREVKFDLFVKAALDNGADYVATGHYCRKQETLVDGNTIYRLLQGSDPNKDQSYFLCQLSQHQLTRALFPIGELLKHEVRDIARANGLATAERKDSQGICFVGKVDLPEFLKQKLKPRTGPIIEIPADLPLYQAYAQIHREWLIDGRGLDLLTNDFRYGTEMGKVAGSHNGAHYFTIGQRKGLHIGGKAEPMFVISTDTIDNNLYVGMGHGHPGLNRWGLFIPPADIHWLRPDCALKPGESKGFLVRIRYRQPLQQATLLMKEEGLYIVFDRKQRGITRGQFAAWYDGEELLGSGVIQ
ncbi:MAG: tRNA 2-thiouridine(34) synthase MnmA [Bacteroidales bacterium]|nr:tRNA 2-thiouridine(34) synthase MnmA [Bacteroidales bacterium]